MAEGQPNEETKPMVFRERGQLLRTEHAPPCKACGQPVAPPIEQYEHGPHWVFTFRFGNSQGEYVCGDCLVEAVVQMRNAMKPGRLHSSPGGSFSELLGKSTSSAPSQ